MNVKIRGQPKTISETAYATRQLAETDKLAEWSLTNKQTKKQTNKQPNKQTNKHLMVADFVRYYKRTNQTNKPNKPNKHTNTQSNKQHLQP